MKKTLVWVMGCALVASISFAADPAPSGTPTATSPATKSPTATRTPSYTPTPKSTPADTPAGAPAATAAPAATPVAAGPENGKVVLQVQGGLGIPASGGLANFTAAGPGFEGMIGYASKDFTLGLECGYGEWPTQLKYGGAGGVNHIPLELVWQYNIDTGAGVTPYWLVCGGLAFDYSTNFIPSETNFEMDPGLGVAFSLAGDMSFFIQAKLAIDFAPNAESQALVIHGNTALDNPILSIPLQLGLNWML